MVRNALALLALVAAACMPDPRVYVDPEVVALGPFPTQDVPLAPNARVVFAWSSRLGDVDVPSRDETSFAQLPADSGAPVALGRDVFGDDVTPFSSVFIVDPIDVASPNVAIEVRGPHPSIHEWATTDVADEEAPGIAAVAIVKAFANGLDDASRFEIAFETPFNGELSLLRIAGDANALLLPQPNQFEPEGPVRYVVHIPGVEPREWCVDVFAVDAAGNETALADDVCELLP